jgi:hypothetical protein
VSADKARPNSDPPKPKIKDGVMEIPWGLQIFVGLVLFVSIGSGIANACHWYGPSPCAKADYQRYPIVGYPRGCV